MVVKNKFDQSAGSPPPKKKKSGKVLKIIGGIVFFFFVLIFVFYTPRAKETFGVCRAYLELNEPYPDQMRFLGLEDYGQVLRVYYRRTDPFGVVSVNRADCVFKVENGVVTPYLKSVDINLKAGPYLAEDPERIEMFNQTVPGVLAAHPDLTWPIFPLDDITKYREFHDDLQ